VAPRIGGFSEDELKELEALLELPDPELADWLSGRRPIPDADEFTMLRRITEAGVMTGVSLDKYALAGLATARATRLQPVPAGRVWR
jgi:hypothetical protein